MEKYKTLITLLAIAIIAFFLRWYLMPSHLFFGPEQGRDFLVIRDIVVNHKFTLIGSKTDVEGVFHGPIYYYLAAIPFAVSKGNPIVVSGFFILIQSLSIFLAYQLAYEFTKVRRAGYIAATLFAVSFLLIVYARWLSNPPLAIPLSMLFILFLLRFIRGQPGYLIAIALVYGLLGQAEFIDFLLFGVIGVLACWQQFFKAKPIIIAISLLVGIVTSFGTYIVFDIRHDYLIRDGFFNLLAGKSGYQVDIITSTLGAFRVLMEQAAVIVGFWNWCVGLVIFVMIAVGVYIQLRKDKSGMLIAFWLIAPPAVFSLLRHGMIEQLYAGIIAGIIIGITMFIHVCIKKSVIIGYTIMLLFITVNIYVSFRSLPINYHVFFLSQQSGVRYSDQFAVIDWMYAKAAGKPFSFQSYTIPYFLQDAWIYLLGYYGKSTYGYLPDNQGRRLQYVVIQSDSLDPNFQKKWYVSATSPWGTKTAQTHIGDFTVEEWTL